MPNLFISSKSSISNFAISSSLCLSPIFLKSAFFASFNDKSAVPPIPIPNSIGGHGFPPALATVSRIKFFIPFIPSAGVSIFKALMFSLPAPFGKTVISISLSKFSSNSKFIKGAPRPTFVFKFSLLSG